MIEHDARPGPLHHCQVCGSEHLRQIIDLGHQPPCDSLLTAAQLKEPEATYPLRLMQCEECSLAQLDYVVPPKIVYPADYPYRAGISWPVVEAHKAMAATLVARFGPGLVVDIGCNDGTLLAQFKALGCGVCGIEPTDIAKIASQSGIETVQTPFNDSVAHGVIAGFGLAHIITMTHVFAHMGDLGEVMRGICTLLAKDGVLVIENHYLADVLERNQFDTIYHEHIRTYTLKSLVRLFDQYGMRVFDVERVSRYAGNIRVYVSRKGMHPVEWRVGALLAQEETSGLAGADVWRCFRDRVYSERQRFLQLIHEHAGNVAGCSAPGRASTLLNFYGVDSYMLPWTGELDGSLKVGKYLPGSHIPVVPNGRIRAEGPDAIVLLAWHYATEITARLRREGITARLITPLPVASIDHAIKEEIAA